MLEEAGLGAKDMGKSLFSVWEDLFCAPNARHKNSLNKDDFGKAKKDVQLDIIPFSDPTYCRQ